MIRHLAAAALTCTFLTGCQTPEQYFKVTDPATGKVYYTTSRGSGRHGNGAITFLDGNTGAQVTLQNSEVQHIGQGEYISHITIDADKANGEKK